VIVSQFYPGSTTIYKGVGAAEERAAIRKRSIEGRNAKAHAGKWVGVGMPPYGYRKIGKGRETRIEIEEEAAEVVRRIFNLFIGVKGKAMTLSGIAALLNAEGVSPPGRYSKHAVDYWHFKYIGRNILSRRAYLGQFSYNGIEINLPEMAIVNADVFELAQRRLEGFKSRPRANKDEWPKYILTGRFTCLCGKNLSGHSSRWDKETGKVARYYRCRVRPPYGNCGQPLLRASKVEGKVWEWLAKVIGDEKRLVAVIREMRQKAMAELEPTRQELSIVENTLGKTKRKIA
jgi:hypothetical protein